MRSTTQEEEEALHLVRNLLRTAIDPQRIQPGMAKTYFSIVLDGQSQKPICRLYFKRIRLIGTISTRKVETIARLNSISHIADFSGDMLVLIRKYIG